MRLCANTLRVIECKSYLDSTGVAAADLMTDGARYAHRYKLFTDPTLRTVVLNRLALQFADMGACRPQPIVRLGLACGHFKTNNDRTQLREHFTAEGWELLDEQWLRIHLARLAQGSYENKTSAVIAYILLRNPA